MVLKHSARGIFFERSQKPRENQDETPPRSMLCRFFRRVPLLPSAVRPKSSVRPLERLPAMKKWVNVATEYKPIHHVTLLRAAVAHDRKLDQMDVFGALQPFGIWQEKRYVTSSTLPSLGLIEKTSWNPCGKEVRKVVGK